jgi:polysaccharide export outer membrane protein
MPPITHPRHSITASILVGLQASISLLAHASLLGLTDATVLTQVSLAQRSINLPQPEPPPATEPQPNQPETTAPSPEQPPVIESPPNQPTATEPLAPEPPLPPRTFGNDELPPRGVAPPPAEGGTSKQFNVYHLDLGDSISVTVPKFPEFNFASVIDPEGNILVPILGRLPLVGLTLSEVEAKISYELGRRYLKEKPEVIASLVNVRPVQLTVLGEVVRPGFYTLAPGATLTGVLLSTGGGTSTADLRSIVVRRTLVDGTVLEEKVDLYTPLIEGKKLPDVRLQGGDTVIVSRLDVGKDQDYDRVLVSRTTLTQQTITVRLLVPVQPAGSVLRNLNLPNGSTFLDVMASLPISESLLVRIDDVALMRFDPEKRKVITQSLNPVAAIEDGDIAQNTPLQDEDVIVVSRTLLGKVFAGFYVLTQPIRDIFSFTSFFRGFNNRFNNF